MHICINILRIKFTSKKIPVSFLLKNRSLYSFSKLVFHAIKIKHETHCLDAIKLYGQTWVGCKPCNLFCSPFKSLLSHSIFKSGDYYIGEFKDGSKHGHGTYWWADGMKYVGK